MANWKNYKNKVYSQQEARKMDYELDLVHELITNIYDDDIWTKRIVELLDKIKRVVRGKQ